jgi:hypothetical protein
MTVPEAVTIAAQLADAADELRADTQREETAP